LQGHGNTLDTKNYTYIHETPSKGINYYRIKQVDYDGQSSYSDVFSVMYETDGGDVRIYPNPVASEVTVEVFQPMEVIVTDILGKLLHKQTVNKENNALDVSGMPSGLLIFSLQNGQKVKVMKE
jgi:trimeric autotransporter adhesin